MPSLIERHALVFASEFDASGIESSMRRARALAGGRRSAAGDRAARGVGAHFPGTRRCRCAVGRAWRDGLGEPREPRVHAGGRPCDEALKELTIRQGLRGSGQSWGAWGQPNTRERRCRSAPKGDRPPNPPTRYPLSRDDPVVVVEVAGIEPASSDDEPELLRAQLAKRFLGSCTRTSTLQTSPVSVSVPVKPSDDS